MISQFYNNDTLLPLLAVSITLYSVMITPKLHSENLDIFNNIFFKLGLVVMVYYITKNNKLMGLILTIGILFTILGLNYNNSIYKVSIINDDNINDDNINDNILLSSDDNNIIMNCLSNRQTLVNQLNDNTILPNYKPEINNKILVHEHIIDSILKANEHSNNISDNKSKDECIYHNDRANKYNIKSKSLLNTIKLRDLLNQNHSDEDIKKILILLTHENNKIDLINNINNEYNNISKYNNNNDKNIIEEHFSNINDYCIDLENKLKLENLDNIINYYNHNDTNIRQSNDLHNLNNLNIDDTNSLNINDNMNYLLLNDTKCNYN